MLNKGTVYVPTLIIAFKYNLDQKLASGAYILESNKKINSEIYCSRKRSWRLSFPICAGTYFTLPLMKQLFKN